MQPLGTIQVQGQQPAQELCFGHGQCAFNKAAEPVRDGICPACHQGNG